MEHLYSIIVPICGVEKYLEECIDSIIEQTYRNIEIILVDDGSPDNCPFICDEYAKKDNRIKVIHKANGGLVSARKAGAMVATGDYICCVDGDDYIASNCVEIINKYVCDFLPNVICFGYYLATENGIRVVDSNSGEGFYNRERLKNEILPWLIQNDKGYYFPASIWGKAIKREIYVDAQNRVDTRIKMGEDAACSMLCISDAESLYIIKESLYYYRFNNSSMSKDGRPMSWESAQCLSEHMVRELGAKNTDFKKQVDRFVCHHFFNVASSQFKSGNSYQFTKKEILEKMNVPVFHEAIMNATFSRFGKGRALITVLRYKFVSLLYLYSKI